MQKAVNALTADNQIRVGHMCLTVTNYDCNSAQKSKQEIASVLKDIFQKQNLTDDLQEKKSNG